MKKNTDLITVQINMEQKEWLDAMPKIKLSLDTYLKLSNHYTQMEERINTGGIIDYEQYNRQRSLIMQEFEEKKQAM